MRKNGSLLPHVLKAILTNVENTLLPVFLRIRAVIPGVDFIVTEVDFLYVAYFCGFLMPFL